MSHRLRPRASGALVLAALLAGTFAGSASAAAGKVIALPMGGTLFLVNSHVICGSGHSNGQTFIDCGIAGKGGQPKAGSYVALMADTGKVAVTSTPANRIVFNRAPAGRERPSAGITARPGDTIRLPTVPAISCQISRLSGKTTILCYFVDKRGIVRPGSYSFGMSDVVTTTLGWDKSRKEHLIGDWPENG
jgi:hypothetical protein